MNDADIILYIFGASCGLALIAFPLFLLAAINRKLEKILISLEAAQYLAEKHDERESNRLQSDNKNANAKPNGVVS